MILSIYLILVNSVEIQSEGTNFEGKEFDSSEAITCEPQTQQNINKDVVDLSQEDGCNRKNQTSADNKSKKEKRDEVEDFHTDDQLLSAVKKRK